MNKYTITPLSNFYVTTYRMKDLIQLRKNELELIDKLEDEYLKSHEVMYSTYLGGELKRAMNHEELRGKLVDVCMHDKMENYVLKKLSKIVKVQVPSITKYNDVSSEPVKYCFRRRDPDVEFGYDTKATMIKYSDNKYVLLSGSILSLSLTEEDVDNRIILEWYKLIDNYSNELKVNIVFDSIEEITKFVTGEDCDKPLDKWLKIAKIYR